MHHRNKHILIENSYFKKYKYLRIIEFLLYLDQLIIRMHPIVFVTLVNEMRVLDVISVIM